MINLQSGVLFSEERESRWLEKGEKRTSSFAAMRCREGGYDRRLCCDWQWVALVEVVAL